MYDVSLDRLFTHKSVKGGMLFYKEDETSFDIYLQQDGYVLHSTYMKPSVDDDGRSVISVFSEQFLSDAIPVTGVRDVSLKVILE